VPTTRSLSLSKAGVFALASSVSLCLLSACSVNVKKEQNGQDKQVDIKTLVGGIHVSKQADASDVGLAVYPGAHPKEKGSDGDDKSANVNISGFGFGLKVVALEYASDAPPDKILAFYKNELKRYGSVLECHISGHVNMNMKMSDKSKGDSHDLTCDDNSGSNIELKAGTRENQHLVAVEPDGKGSSFSLVYLRTHGKENDI
jgi:hypothetical protein